MILRRQGSKQRIAAEILKYFPAHRSYVELFFGAGGMFFKKPLAQYNICNDYDDDVYNLWMIVKNDRAKLVKELSKLPISDSILKYYQHHTENDPIKRAVRFLMLSNFTMLSSGHTLTYGNNNEKKIIADRIDATFEMIKDVRFMCTDFRKVVSKISLSDEDKKDYFIYADPPYLNTTQNYQSGFKLQDTIDLFETLKQSKIRFAISEFDDPSVLALAKYHKLKVIRLMKRINLKNVRQEILITNY
jgi:DNA adenine methylase